MCLKFIDSEKEKDIGVGVSWPYEKLEKNECLIASDFALKGVSVGDEVRIIVQWSNYWNNLRTEYNKAALLNGWEEFPWVTSVGPTEEDPDAE